MTNKEEIESVLHEIEVKCDVHIKDYKITNWLEDLGEDTICNFHIRELQGYLFCLWNTCNVADFSYFDRVESDDSYIFFVDYEENINKFKPGYCGFEVGISKYQFINDTMKHENNIWCLYDIEAIITFMRKHRYRAYYNIALGNNDIWDYNSGFKCFMTYISDKLYRFKEAFKDNIKEKYLRHIVLRHCKKLTQLNVITYQSENLFPQFTIIVRRKSDNVDKQLWQKDWKRLEYLDKHYFLDINLDYCECFTLGEDDEPLTGRDIEQDKNMQQRFNEINELFSGNNENYLGKLIYRKISDNEYED